jgi:phage tail sheath gpL-like
MAFSVIQVEHQKAAASLLNTLNLMAASPKLSLRRLGDFFRGMAVGAYRGTVSARIGAVKATATLTFTGAPTADETFVVCGVTFTAKDSGATGDQFNIGANVTATAANVVTAVNASASTDVTGAVIASSSEGVVTFTALVAGTAGNGFVLTESMTNATRVDFAGGTNGTTTSLAAGGAS